MDILSLAGTLLLAAAQPQQAPTAQPAPEAHAQGAPHVKVFSGASGADLRLSKVGAGKLEIAAGKVNEERPTDLSDAPPSDPTALLIPAVQTLREAAARRQ